jgi:glucan 1,3-beta-glucosidase
MTVGAEAIMDTTVTNTDIFIRTSAASSPSKPRSLVLNNIKLTNVPIAVGVNGGATVLKGGTTTIGTWGQGNTYSGTSGNPTFVQGNITPVNKPSSLLASTGKVYGRTHPQYESYDVSEFVSVRSEGAVGDGSTDDTDAIKAIFKKVSYAQYMLVIYTPLTGIV